MKAVRPAAADVAPRGPEPTTTPAVPLVLAIWIFSLVVLLCFLFFAWAQAAAFIHMLRISTLIFLARAALDLQYYVRRSTSPFVSTSAYAWLIALCGTIMPLMLRPTDDASDFWVATMLQVIGGALQVYIIRTLNPGLGVTVAWHGIRRDGLHRFFRHPLYLTFMLSQYGYVLNHTSLYNLCVLALATLFQVLRINEEERLLLDDEGFQDYAEQTPWRVIPGVF